MRGTSLRGWLVSAVAGMLPVLAFTSTSASGCSSDDGTPDNGTTTDASQTGCPKSVPTIHSKCSLADNTSCPYTCGDVLICSKGTWIANDAGPAAACPTALPTAGAACCVDESVCVFDRCALKGGGTQKNASCTNGKWTIVTVDCVPVADAG